jgi:hypothetical protein
MSDHELHVLCYFDGGTLDAIVAELNEYEGDPTRRLKVKKQGNDYFLQACTDTDGGGNENDSHPCPGSPGCP